MVVVVVQLVLVELAQVEEELEVEEVVVQLLQLFLDNLDLRKVHKVILNICKTKCYYRNKQPL